MKTEDQVFVDGLNKRLTANQNERKELAKKLAFASERDAGEINARLIEIDAQDLRIKNLLELAKKEGLSPNRDENGGDLGFEMDQFIRGKTNHRTKDMLERVFGKSTRTPDA